MSRLHLRSIESCVIRLAARAFFGLDGAVYSERNVARMAVEELRCRVDAAASDRWECAQVAALLARAELVLREYDDACAAYEALA